MIVSYMGESETPCMQFDVVDTGVGMTPEQVAGLFRPFAQADDSTVRRFGGTGLGLAISRHFARLLGGDITVVESGESVGTRFRATIAAGPAEDDQRDEDADSVRPSAEPLRKDAPITTESPLGGLHVLLAEDGPDNQKLISFVLKKAGALVTVVENGKLATRAALAAIGGGRAYDVVLMDMQMPVMDGYTAVALLRRVGLLGTDHRPDRPRHGQTTGVSASTPAAMTTPASRSTATR